MEDEWTLIPQLPDCKCEEEFVDVGRGVKLRVLKWTPAELFFSKWKSVNNYTRMGFCF